VTAPILWSSSPSLMRVVAAPGHHLEVLFFRLTFSNIPKPTSPLSGLIFHSENPILLRSETSSYFGETRFLGSFFLSELSVVPLDTGFNLKKSPRTLGIASLSIPVGSLPWLRVVASSAARLHLPPIRLF